MNFSDLLIFWKNFGFLKSAVTCKQASVQSLLILIQLLNDWKLINEQFFLFFLIHKNVNSFRFWRQNKILNRLSGDFIFCSFQFWNGLALNKPKQNPLRFQFIKALVHSFSLLAFISRNLGQVSEKNSGRKRNKVLVSTVISGKGNEWQ